MDPSYKKPLEVRFRRIRDSYYLVRRNEVFELDEVAFEIWRNCDGQKSFNEIIDILLDVFDVLDRDSVENDCKVFLEQAVSQGLLIRT